MTQTSLPAARASFVEQDGRPTPQFYRFLETLATAQTGNASASDIAEINAQLAALQDEIDALPESSDVPKLQVTYPILSQGLLQNGFAKLALNQPGDTGTGSLLAFVKDAWGRITGTKAATITGTAGRVTVANGDASAGLPTIDLATVADTGGGSLLRFVRDAWGRITGTSTPSTTDLAEGSNLYYTDTRADARITLQKGQPSGLATLDSGGKLDAGQLPALAITETFVVNSQTAMLALVAEEGDVAVRTDQNKSYILTAAPSSTLANWQELLSPSSAVTSVFGRVGAVTAASGDYTFAQIASKPTTLAGYGITDAATIAQGTKADNADVTINALKVRTDNRVTDWNASIATDVFRSIGSASGSTNGPGANFYSGIRTQYATGSGGDIVTRATATASELWFRGISAGSPSPWKQAATTDAVVANLGTVTNLDAVNGDAFFDFSNTATSAPVIGAGYDAVGLQMSSAGQTTQIVSIDSSANCMLVRVNDGGGYAGWRVVQTVAL